MGEPDDDPRRALLNAVLAMAGVAVVVGLIVGVGLLGLVRVSGLEGGGSAEGGAPPSLFIPKYQPTPSERQTLNLPSQSASASASAEPKKKKKRKPQITLFVAPQSAAPGERVNMNGVYPAGEGASLQVQRKEGGRWTDFPVTASVRGGSFETWIQTSRTGRQVFRMYDRGADRGSNTVAVTIG